MSLPIITVVGSLNTDLVTRTSRLPAPGETLTATSFSTGSGGKGANQAVACARLSRSKDDSCTPSVKVNMMGAVGDDTFGKDLIAGLKHNGVDASGVKVVQGARTGTAVVIVEEETGENRILITPGANGNVSSSICEEVFKEPCPDLVVLQLEIPVETVVAVIRTARTKRVAVLLNPAPAIRIPDDIYDGLEHLVLNESEAIMLVGAEVSRRDPKSYLRDVGSFFARKGVRNVIITRGDKGAFYWASQEGGDESEWGFIDAAPVTKVVDTTGAGDTFVGAYAVGVVEGREVEKALRWANRAAGKAVEKEGAQSAIPWRDEVPVV